MMRRLVRLLILVAGLASGALAAPAFDSCATAGTSNNVNTVVATITAIAGHLIFVDPSENSDSTGNATVTDTAGNNWTGATAGNSIDDGGNLTHRIYWTVANGSGSTTITADWGASKGTQVMLVCMFSGVNAEDVSHVKAGSGFPTSLTSNSFTTSQNDAVLVWCIRTGGGISGPTAGANFTIPTNGTAGGRAACQYRIVSSIQSGVTTSLSWTTGARVGGAFIAFKQAAAAAVDAGGTSVTKLFLPNFPIL